MEDLSEASGLNQRASALDPETVSETDVPQVRVGSSSSASSIHILAIGALEWHVLVDKTIAW